MAPRVPEVELREPLPADGVSVPLLATFAGLARVPLLSLGKNNLSARLRLYPDELEFKMLRTLRRPYSDIQRIGVQTAWATRNVEFVWQDSIMTFTANVRSDAWRLALLRFLEGRGAPLAPAAVELLRRSE